MLLASRIVRLPAAVLVTLAATVPALTPGTAAAASACVQDWRPAPSPIYLEPDGSPASPPIALGPAPTPRHQAFHVFCGGHYVNTVWLPPQPTLVDLAVAARDVVAKARYPSVHPGVNPGLGITGLASWFWATTDAAPVHMVAGNGPPIDLELRIQSVRWRFGDGTTASVTGFGSPYPASSAVQHVFERTGTFTVEAQVALVGRVRFDELDFEVPGEHLVTLRHDIAEVRSLLHAG